MRVVRTVVVTLLLLVAAGPLAAQPSRFALFAGIQPGGSYSDNEGVEVDLGWSLGLEVPIQRAWSAELMVFLEELGASYSESAGTNLQLGDRQMYDASAKYLLGEVGNWGFRGGLGLRYGHQDAAAGFSSSELWTTFGSLSADWHVSRRFSFRLEGRHALVDLSGDSERFGERVVTTGLTARF